MITATRKIGQNRGKPRLWIEGKLLVDAGLDHGQRWDLLPNPEGDGFFIRRCPTGKRKIAGKPGRPIIDIAGGTLTQFGFASGDTARLEYTEGAATIEVRPAS